MVSTERQQQSARCCKTWSQLSSTAGTCRHCNSAGWDSTAHIELSRTHQPPHTNIFSLETHSLERVRMCDVSRETYAWGRRVLSCDNSWIFAAVHTETTTELAAGVIASCSHLTYAPLPYHRAIGGIRTAQHSLRGCPSYLQVSVRCYVNSNLHNNTA